MAEKELKVDKKEVQNAQEFTQEGPVFNPDVDIYETEENLVLIADLPGVQTEDLDIDLNENTLTINGHVKKVTKGTSVYREYECGDYKRSFTVSSVIDQNKIKAELKNGVLRVVLPKAEAAKPRKIQIRTQ
ncbi:MAG: heat shock protein HSP20 [Candidatus Magnetoglobus multicellularis str. Araruama]|uniref:Heat shock protein HSP20 n=1 Tax=Candidatus Magnetoglobus multicellularis str. Araruama TaxID=890399 RepID=A0A1V1P262_9BACT|nr:MAG: heat shock protein HSP20 [Candidatus Magnetoglobus multicellularis str. Araruama]